MKTQNNKLIKIATLIITFIFMTMIIHFFHPLSLSFSDAVSNIEVQDTNLVLSLSGNVANYKIVSTSGIDGKDKNLEAWTTHAHKFIGSKETKEVLLNKNSVDNLVYVPNGDSLDSVIYGNLAENRMTLPKLVLNAYAKLAILLGTILLILNSGNKYIWRMHIILYTSAFSYYIITFGKGSYFLNFDIIATVALTLISTIMFLRIFPENPFTDYLRKRLPVDSKTYGVQ